MKSGTYTIWFQDEVHFYRSTTIRSMWSKKGKQPLVKSAPTQEKIAFSGFVNPENGALKTHEIDYFNYETCMDSIKNFISEIHYPGRKILIVLDNASWHKKAVRLITEHVLMPEVEFLFLPPYSPDFNPIERVWRMTRYKRTHNRYFAKLAILKDTLCSYFAKYRRPNNTMKQLCLNYN